MHRLFKNPYLNIAVISILALLIYMPTLHGHFIHDDQPNLVTNNQVQIKNLDIDSLKNAATSSGAGTLKRPISMGSFALNYYFFGESPFSFKLTNVVLHIITGILVYLVTFFLLNSISKKENINSSIWFASIVALIWMIHPLHVSTVAYVIQRMAILSTIFSLLAIMFYLIGRIKLLNKSQVWSQYFFLCIVSIVLGVFSKENAILVPILIILIEIVIFYPQTYSDSLKITAKYSFTIFSLVVLFTIFIFRQDIYSHLLEWYYSTREFTISERLYTQSRIIIHYIKWLLFPNIQEMGLFHDDIQNSTSLISPITTLLSILTICALAIFAIVIRKMIPLASLGIGWFFTGHLLESTIIPLEMVYEHRNYLPSVGLIIAVISILDKLININKELYKFSYILILVITIIFSLSTFTRAKQWSDPINFAYFETLHHPDSLRANHTLGMVYKNMVEEGYEEYKIDAYKYLEKASQLGEKRLFSEAALIALADNLNETAKPAWIDRMADKLSIPAPRIDDIELLKSITSCKGNTCILPVDAALLLFDALESNPRLNTNHATQAYYHAVRANFILLRGLSPSEAEIHFKKAIELAPFAIQYYVDYIHLLLTLGRPSDAETYFSLAEQNNKFRENIPILTKLNKIIEKNAH